MSSELDWSPEYCLNCDKQTEGAYCSQACRLAESEKAAHSEQSVSPLSTSASSTGSYYAQSTQYQSQGFYLPPAVDFQNYQYGSQRSGQANHGYTTSTSPTTSSNSPASYYYPQQSPTYTSYADSSQASHSPPKRLSASSSRTSLSAFQNGHFFSPRTTSTLHSYNNAFDQVRQSKQRYHRASQS